MAKKKKPVWQKMEHSVCDSLGLARQGGPGKPDCGTQKRRGRKRAEVVDVKHWQTPISASACKKIMDRPWARGKGVRIVATGPGGFGPSALALERRRSRLTLEVRPKGKKRKR